ncbi:MAG TPA: hypothetical protein VN612_09015 [Acidobacteriaceae bacterium]|nr:hypothetical protein [Acidobacteriaceae bacterium]
MWPKILLELLPHFTRLVPLADKYFSSRGDQDKAHAAALSALGEEVRGGLGRVEEMHAGLQQALREQSERIAEVGVEATRARMAVETVEQRTAKLERKIAMLTRIVGVALVLLAAAILMLLNVMWKLKAR